MAKLLGKFLEIDTTDGIKLFDDDLSNYVALKAGSVVPSNLTFTLPTTYGTSGQILSSDGAGGLSWVSASGGITWSTPVDANIIPDANTAYTIGDITYQFSEIWSTAITSNTSLIIYANSGNTTIGSEAGSLELYSAADFVNIQPYSPGIAPALRFSDSGGVEYVAFRSPITLSGSTTYTLPSADGTSGQVLSTDGAGNLSWAAGGGITWATLVDSNVTPDTNGAYNLGDSLYRWSYFYAQNCDIVNLTADTDVFVGNDTGDAYWQHYAYNTANPGDTYQTYSNIFTALYVGSDNANRSAMIIDGGTDFIIGTKPVAGSSPGLVFVTGDATSTFNSGDISLITGTVVSGTRGKILFNATAVETESDITTTTAQSGTANLGNSTNFFSTVYATQLFSNPTNTLTLNGDAGINYQSDTGPHTFTATASGIVVPTLSSDPAGAVDGEIWYNTTTNKLKVWANGVAVDLH